jgi:hypothetical protein
MKDAGLVADETFLLLTQRTHRVEKRSSQGWDSENRPLISVFFVRSVFKNHRQ